MNERERRENQLRLFVQTIYRYNVLSILVQNMVVITPIYRYNVLSILVQNMVVITPI